MKHKNIYTSIACNRTTEAADWGKNGLIAFGACNAVAIFDPKYNGYSAKVTHTFVQHKKRVNTVKWLHQTRCGNETHLLSGSDDGTAVFWNIENIDKPKTHVLHGHASGVTVVAGAYTPSSGWLLVTAAADSTIKLWRDSESDSNFVCLQTLELKTGYCFAICLTQLPKLDQLILAFSTDDETVQLWVQGVDGERLFRPTHKLHGHEDWVRGLDFIEDGDDLLLASSSQDNFIRLWRIARRSETQVEQNVVDILNLLDDSNGEIRVEEKILELAPHVWFAMFLESVLCGHEGWVYSVNWHKSNEHGLRLLSASIDKTLIIWQPNEDGVWLETVRVGDVGGNSLGFYGGKFSREGTSIFGHSYQGGFHIWQQVEDWQPNVIISGHFGEVRDLSWEPQGEYLMSVSADQTTRIHAPWRSPRSEGDITWHELARPQVHGYDMQALAILSRYKFASGAEEKIVRTFQTSANFIENFRALARIQEDEEGDKLLEALPKGASVPSLGLSNKAIYNLEPSTDDKHVKDQYPEHYFVPLTLEIPPQEEVLMQNTLWPEVQKLYGHGFEIYALAASPDGNLLASSCRSTNAEHAKIILWNTSTFKQIQKLASHQLTVTQMRFSPNGRYLLSVSRDRRWSLFEQQLNEDGTSSYALSASTDKTNGVHARIIWACDWAHDNKMFATSSRDGKVAIWTHGQESTTTVSSLSGWHALEVLELKNESITAIAFAPKHLQNDAYLLALGLESGLIKIYQFDGKWTHLLSLTNDQAHHLTVKRLQFQPARTNVDTSQFYLASCGDDYLVRIHELNL